MQINYLKTLFLITLAIIISACSTPYQKSGATGGYSDKQLSHNEFMVQVNINGYTSWNKMMDYVLLRTSELALENGYEYFMLLNSANRQAVSIEGFNSNRKPDNGHAWAKYIGKMFRRKPIYGKDFYFDAMEQFREICKRLEISCQPPQRHPQKPVESTDLGKDIRYSTEMLDIVKPPATPGIAYFGAEENLMDRAVPIGHYADAERPIDDLNIFKQKLTLAISESKVNAVKIIENENLQLNRYVTAFWRYSIADQFIAQLYAKPSYYLGLQFEPGKLASNEYVIRGFYEKSAEKYLKLDDKILSINGIDTLDFQKIVKNWFEWKADSQIKLVVIRSGNKVSITMPVFLNP